MVAHPAVVIGVGLIFGVILIAYVVLRIQLWREDRRARRNALLK